MNRTAQVLAAINRITRQYFRDRSNLLDTIARFAIPEDIHTNHRLAERRLTSLVLQDINANNQLGIQVSAHNAVLQKAMRSCLVSIKLATKDTNTYNDVILRALIRAETEARERGIKDTASLHDVTPEQAREIVADWLSKLAERNEILFRNLTKEFQA